MATDKKGDQPQASRPPRKPVTIDLDAKDVKDTTARTSDTAKTAPSGAAASPSAKPDDSQSGSAAPSASSAAAKPATGSTSAATSATSPAAKDSGAKDGGAKPAATASGDAKAASTATSAGGASAAKPASSPASPSAAAKDGDKAQVKPEQAKPDLTKPDLAKPEPAKSASAPSSAAASASADTASPARRGGVVGWFAAALLGGVVSLAGGYGLQMAGVLPAPAASDMATQADVSGNADKVAALEARLDAFLKEAPSSAVSAQEQAALRDRIDAVAKSVDGQADSAQQLADKVDTLATKTDALADVGDQVSELRRLISSGSQGPDVALESLQGEIADLRTKVDAVAAPAATDAGLSDAVEALSKRVDELEANLRDFKPAEQMQSALAPVEEQMKALSAAAGERQAALDAVTAAAGQSSEAVAGLKADLAGIASRVDGIEKVVGGPGARETAARAVAVTALSSAVDAGRPYATELAAVKATLGDKVDLAALSAHAETGIAGKDALIKQFPAIADKALATLSRPASDAGFLDRLMSNAESVVTVRTTGDVEGNGVAAVIARMRGRVASGDLVGAVDQWGQVDAGDADKAAVAIVAPWVETVRARLAADKLMQTVTGEVLSLLSAGTE